MVQKVSRHGQPSPLRSSEEEPRIEYGHTSVPQQPYTPPRSFAKTQFKYGNPEDFEMVQTHSYFENPAFCHSSPYHTPPLPLKSAMHTRSGKSQASPETSVSSPSTRYTPSPRPKRGRGAKKSKVETLPINEPLSVMTRDYDVPVMDMMCWANRPNEDRYREVDTKHKGKIPRPMNSFMLYRTAYKERIKKWGQQGDNNQLISKVAGLSWPLESVELRDFYAKCANIERDNHAKAFPNYKFAPNKQSKKRSRDDDNDEDESDPEWDGDSEYSGKRSRRRQGRYISRSLSSTPAPGSVRIPSEYHHPSSFRASNPHGMLPMMGLDQWGRPIQYTQVYYPGVGYEYQTQANEMHFTTTSEPTHLQETAYESQLVGMPPPSAEEGIFASNLVDHSEMIVDPSLENFILDADYQYGSYPVEHQLQTDPRSQQNTNQVAVGPVIHPGMQMLTVPESTWPRPQPGNAFDAEFNRWAE